MESRRKFLQLSAAALTAAAAKPLFGAGIQGANDRVRMGIIGTGNRGGRVFDSLVRSKDCQFLTAAEVNKAKLDQWMTAARQTFNLKVEGDYRRILDRKDIDAVLIATPDHWHSQQLVDAISAGKDVYVEKPASNTVPRINATSSTVAPPGPKPVEVFTKSAPASFANSDAATFCSSFSSAVSRITFTMAPQACAISTTA